MYPNALPKKTMIKYVTIFGLILAYSFICAGQTNAEPVAEDDIFTFAGLSYTGNVLADNGYGADQYVETNLSVAVDTDVTFGTLILYPNGNFEYTPVSGFKGADSFTYTVTDLNGISQLATVTINVVDAVFRPGNHIDHVGNTSSPSDAYDEEGLQDTSAETTIKGDAFPSISYDGWQPTGSSPENGYGSLTLNISFSSENTIDDRWGMEYSTDNGNSWRSLGRYRDRSKTTISEELDIATDLNQLIIRVFTDRIKKVNYGRNRIYEIWTEGIFAQPVVLQQSGHQFFKNIDSVDLSAIVSRISGDAEAKAIAVDNEFIYTALRGPNGWRLEKRGIDTGELVNWASSNNIGEPEAMAMNDDFLFVVGRDQVEIDIEANVRWRIEKRSKSTLDLEPGFGDDTNGDGTGDGIRFSDPSDGIDIAYDIALDLVGNSIVVIGSDLANGGSDSQWRIEKVDQDSGSLLAEITENQGAGKDIPRAIAIYQDCIVLAGYESIKVDSNSKGKSKKKEIFNPQWRIEKRLLSDLSYVTHYSYAPPADYPTDGFDTATDIAIDAEGNVYVIGIVEKSFFDMKWRYEMLDSNLNRVWEEGKEYDPGRNDQARAIALYEGFSYIAGYSAEIDSGGDTEWCIVKFDGSGDIVDSAINDIYPDNNDGARAIAIGPNSITDPTPALYIAGYNNPFLSQPRVEKRSINDLTLSFLKPIEVPPSFTIGEDFRLRMLINVQSGVLLQGNQFRLQYQYLDGVPNWQDVDDNLSSHIAFKDNPTPEDGDILMGNTQDPSNGYPTLNQTYEEVNPFSIATSKIETGYNGIWDFSLVVNASALLGQYSLRIVKDDGSPLDVYSAYPEITIE
jgi:hypothetical protein